jgi:hypothetical protein
MKTIRDLHRAAQRPDTLEEVVRRIARRRAVELHTPSLIPGESPLEFLARATDMVDSAAAQYQKDPEILAEAKRVFSTRSMP